MSSTLRFLPKISLQIWAESYTFQNFELKSVGTKIHIVHFISDRRKGCFIFTTVGNGLRLLMCHLSACDNHTMRCPSSPDTNPIDSCRSLWKNKASSTSDADMKPYEAFHSEEISIEINFPTIFHHPDLWKNYRL